MPKTLVNQYSNCSMSENKLRLLKKRFPDTYCKFPFGIKWPYKEQEDWRYAYAIRATRKQFIRRNISILIKPIDAIDMIIKTMNISKYWI